MIFKYQKRDKFDVYAVLSVQKVRKAGGMEEKPCGSEKDEVRMPNLCTWTFIYYKYHTALS